jgi:hypothetical protein
VARWGPDRTIVVLSFSLLPAPKIRAFLRLPQNVGGPFAACPVDVLGIDHSRRLSIKAACRILEVSRLAQSFLAAQRQTADREEYRVIDRRKMHRLTEVHVNAMPYDSLIVSEAVLLYSARLLPRRAAKTYKPTNRMAPTATAAITASQSPSPIARMTTTQVPRITIAVATNVRTEATTAYLFERAGSYEPTPRNDDIPLGEITISLRLPQGHRCFKHNFLSQSDYLHGKRR